MLHMCVTASSIVLTASPQHNQAHLTNAAWAEQCPKQPCCTIPDSCKPTCNTFSTLAKRTGNPVWCQEDQCHHRRLLCSKLWVKRLQLWMADMHPALQHVQMLF